MFPVIQGKSDTLTIFGGWQRIEAGPRSGSTSEAGGADMRMIERPRAQHGARPRTDSAGAAPKSTRFTAVGLQELACSAMASLPLDFAGKSGMDGSA